MELNFLAKLGANVTLNFFFLIFKVIVRTLSLKVENFAGTKFFRTAKFLCFAGIKFCGCTFQVSFASIKFRGRTFQVNFADIKFRGCTSPSKFRVY